MAQKRRILVTSALIYANGKPHLGHLVGTIQSDIWVRFQRMQGHDCVFICGSDSHGTPIMIKAESLGMTPEALIKDMHQAQLNDFQDFHIEFDNYHPTHSPENKKLVTALYQKLLENGHIDKKEIQQLYDPVKQMFLPDRYIKGECPKCNSPDQYGDNCEVCGSTYAATELKNPYSTLSGSQPVEKTSLHYFFRLTNFKEFLQGWLAKIDVQEQVKNKLAEWFDAGLREWDISRDAPYFGFLIPDEKDKYFYVWLDAPIGYMASFLNLCEQRKSLNFDDYWLKDDIELYHFIGKDIIYFHTLFWPAILQGSGHRTPTGVFVNGFLTIDGQKMSKSRGTFIPARTFLKHLNPEYLRYYFAAKLSAKIEDIDINFDDFLKRINADLVGKFVNIASRTASFLNKNLDNRLSDRLVDPKRFDHFSAAGDAIAKHISLLDYSQAVREIMALADQANQYIDEHKPWQKIKEDQIEEVRDVCTMGINFFRQLMIYLKPILPETAKAVEQFLKIAPLQWADKDKPLVDHEIATYQPLLMRIDPQQIAGMKMDAKENIEAKPVKDSEPVLEKFISIDDFNKIDLRVAKVLHAEAVEGADKLLRLEVDIDGDKRQIFAGIKSAYQPSELVGRHVVVVANLAPRKMRFGESQGMVIVASGKESQSLFIVSPDPGAESGMKVK